MERKLLNWNVTAFILMLFMFCSACNDDLESGGSTDFEEGLPATISFAIRTSDQSVFTRSSDVDDSYVNDLYVAFYRQSDGLRVWSKYYKDLPNNPDVNFSENEILFKESFESMSGVMIVAIANIAAENEMYITYIDDTTYGLNKFLNLKQLTYTRSTEDAKDINHYTTTYMMTGWADTQARGSSANISDIPTFDIRPGDNKLPGAIYLRRLEAHNKFNVKAGDNVSLKINTWQVCNVPKHTYFFEHESSSGSMKDSYVNSEASHVFSTETNPDTGDTYKTFEFYLLENKHSACTYDNTTVDGDYVGIRTTAGLTSAELYQDREREFKKNSTDATANSGVYKSLVGYADYEGDNLANNFASYVVLNADIDYYIVDTPENRADPGREEAVPVDPATYTGSLIHRTANVNYTIHLGFCDGTTDQEKARDFNCYRNSKYTYNVTINGVRNVVVEATKEDEEPQPGAEGTVYDSYADEITLDSHYCEFNINLTDEERDALIYRITSPYDGTAHVFYVNPNKGSNYDEAWEDDELFTWIKFYPTTDSLLLAEYDETKLWSIEAMRHPDTHPGVESTTARADQSKWYTVFVDEYVYHKDDSAEGLEDSWPKYVNQDNRTVELIKNSDVSKDGESDYAFCKFVFEQKSIQTYYNSTCTTALGVEHTDETYCLNMIWSGTQSSSHSSSVYSFENGAYNLWGYIKGNQINKKWSSAIQATIPCTVMEDYNDAAKVMTHHDAARYPVYLPSQAGTQTNVTYLNTNGFPSPHDSRYYYANGICMNRNRDLNHDGVIDPEEVRWYNPTSAEYIQISIGQGELPDPLMQFGDHDPDELRDNTGTSERAGTYYYHHITSDYQYFWAEQSVNVGDKPYNQALTQCYTARCVRHLGTQRSSDATTLEDKTTPVAKTYTHDTDAHTITLGNYTDISLRGYTAGALAPHNVATVTGRPYKKFEYATDVCRNISDDYVSVDSNGKVSYLDGASDNLGRTTDWYMSLRHNGICSQYYQESDQSDKGSWRVPNLKEVAFLYMENLVQTSKNDGGLLSSTYDFFTAYELKDNETITKLFMGYNDLSGRQVLARDIVWSGDNPNPTIKVRCVRDIR